MPFCQERNTSIPPKTYKNAGFACLTGGSMVYYTIIGLCGAGQKRACAGFQRGETCTMMITCPHCQAENDFKVIDHINIDRNPELRAKVQDLSCFRIECPNCGETAIAVHPCLYHDMSNQFMVWLWPEEDNPPRAEFDPLAGYKLRIVDSLNGFREKISILERGLDDRTIEIMKLLLFSQLNRDLDVVELLFHELDERTGDFRFVAVLSDGAEQYAAMPGAAYQKLHEDVEAYLYTSGGEFARIDMQWAQQALELLHELG